MLTEFCVCGANANGLEDEARRYQGKFVESNFHHYEFLGEHFKTVKGYDAYQQKADLARKGGGLEGAVVGLHAGRLLGHAGQDPARARGAAEAARRLRDERRLPLRRHAL
jgi:hypothetical protein